MSSPVGHAAERVGAATIDVAVIGAGIVGSAIARELAGHQLSVALLEARHDVGDGTSKANTAILHTGFDAKPDTLEARLVRRGSELLHAYARVVGIPIERTGAVLVAWTDEELAALPGLRSQAERNGYVHCEVVDADEVYRRVAALGPGALGGLTVPDESITCTWTTNLALATEAVLRGARLVLDCEVTGVDIGAEATVLATSAGPLPARWVINAAGLAGDTIDGMFGHERFTLTPRRGELLVFDKFARPLVDKIVLPVPTAAGKGVLVSPTIYGNVMLGPTAENLTDRTDTGTTEAGLAFLLDKGRRIMPALLGEEVTATYAGLRAASDLDDYLIDVDRHHRYGIAGGIRSTGLTSGMAVAEHICRALADAGMPMTPKRDLPEPPSMPNLGEASLRPYQDGTLITSDPAYGQVVCFCERVTAGEVRDALDAVIPATDIGGLRRRTRAMNGRCQGFYCGARITAMVADRIAAAEAQPTSRVS